MCMLLSNLRMDDLLETFLGNMWARMKHARKPCGDLWDQSTILEVIPNNYLWPRKGSGCYRWYQRWPATVRCISKGESPSNHLAGQRYLVRLLVKTMHKSVVSKPQRGCCALQVGVIVIPLAQLKWIEVNTHINKSVPSFLGAYS